MASLFFSNKYIYNFMPIGVPRIIYCWGEEIPAQWTDIYNFIFRRRMVFLMQYLDDELCNQICGLLINIHMEDRSKDLEKKELEKLAIREKTLTASINYLKTDQGIEDEIRTKFRAVKDGENVVVIVDSQATVTSVINTSTTTTSFWYRLFHW